jgi:hypothetical protein
MPLPLPNLDTRRWNDLVAEGVSLIPRYSETWTDFNIHDPGITITELLAWFVEQDVYRVNRVPDRHRRKFLELLGFPPLPPQAAVTPVNLTLTAASAPTTLPAGALLSATDRHTRVFDFRTLTDVTAVPAAVRTLQVDDGSTLTDWTRFWGEQRPIPAFGPNVVTDARTYAVQPGDTIRSIAQATESTIEDLVALNRLSGPTATLTPGRTLSVPASTALYLGFDASLPAAVPITIWFELQGEQAGLAERQRIVAEQAGAETACRAPVPEPECTPCPLPPDPWCPAADWPPLSATDPPIPVHLVHHSVRLAWEYYAASPDPHWIALDPASGAVVDDTRSLTLDGSVVVTLPTPMAARALGAVSDPRFYLRCRPVAGRYDAAPTLLDTFGNAALAEQSWPLWQDFPIGAGVVPAGPVPAPGATTRLQLTLDGQGTITQLTFDPALAGAPDFTVLGYIAPTAATAGSLTLALVFLGSGTGRPVQRLSLPRFPLAGPLELWTLEGGGWRGWTVRPDFDASGRTDAHISVDATSGLITGGDGEQGRVFPDGTPILARCRVTDAATGNISAACAWTLPDPAPNRALMPTFPTVSAAISSITNRLPANGGAGAETIQHAAGRAAQTVWAHERLIELAEAAGAALGTSGVTTLDALDRAAVRALPAPERAATLFDYERIALDVPGTQMVRARAWATIDPAYPCLFAAGTVTVILVPSLPSSAPAPTDGLLRTVRQYLNRRRTLGTRLVVAGPEYLRVSVRAVVHLEPGADATAVPNAVAARLDAYFDPLTGGAAGRGWPFGRSVYIADVLQIVGSVAGVDHVLHLDLSADGGEAQCGNLCLGPTMLVTPGTHSITVG